MLPRVFPEAESLVPSLEVLPMSQSSRVTSPAPAAPTARADRRWRTRDIVVAAVIGVAFGVVFVVAGGIWSGLAFLGPVQNVLYAVWLLPAIVAPLVVRQP